jgi:hypothetical protein
MEQVLSVTRAIFDIYASWAKIQYIEWFNGCFWHDYAVLIFIQPYRGVKVAFCFAFNLLHPDEEKAGLSSLFTLDHSSLRR